MHPCHSQTAPVSLRMAAAASGTSIAVTDASFGDGMYGGVAGRRARDRVRTLSVRTSMGREMGWGRQGMTQILRILAEEASSGEVASLFSTLQASPLSFQGRRELNSPQKHGRERRRGAIAGAEGAAVVVGSASRCGPNGLAVHWLIDLERVRTFDGWIVTHFSHAWRTWGGALARSNLARTCSNFEARRHLLLHHDVHAQ
jgi:hypothetical protein